MKCCDLLVTCCASRLLLTTGDGPMSSSNSTTTTPSLLGGGGKQSIWLSQPTSACDPIKRRQTFPDLSPTAAAAAALALERRLSSTTTTTGSGDGKGCSHQDDVLTGIWRRRRRKEQQVVRQVEPMTSDVTNIISLQQPDGTGESVIPQVHSTSVGPRRRTTGSLPSLFYVVNNNSQTNPNPNPNPTQTPTQTRQELSSSVISRSALVLTQSGRKPETVLVGRHHRLSSGSRSSASRSTSSSSTSSSSSDDVTMMDDEDDNNSAVSAVSAAAIAVHRYLHPAASWPITDGCRSAPTTPHLSLVSRKQQQRRSKSSYGFNDPVIHQQQQHQQQQQQQPITNTGTTTTITASSITTCNPATGAHQSPVDSHCSSGSTDPNHHEGLVNYSQTSSQDDLLSSPPPVLHRRFLKLLSEGDIQLCRVTHSGTVIGKILSSKFLRRWETHHLYLNDAQISSKTPSGFMEESVPYSSMKEVNLVVSSASTSTAGYWDPAAVVSNPPSTTPAVGQITQHHCLIRIVLPEGCLLLQANNTYVRDQWYHSIIWKKNLFRYHQITRRTTRQEVLLKEVKSMVELATSTPLQDHCIAQAPFQVISSLLSTVSENKSQHHQQRIGMPGGCYYSQTVLEDLLLTLSPLLERQPPSREMCTAFSRHCRLHPRSSLVRGLFTSVVHRILKHNVDFGKNPFMRRFVHDYIRVLYAHNDGPQAVRDFVRNAHGEGSACPHPRVLPNLVAVCLAAAFSIYEYRRRRQRNPSDWVNIQSNHPVHNDKLAATVEQEQQAGSSSESSNQIAEEEQQQQTARVADPHQGSTENQSDTHRQQPQQQPTNNCQNNNSNIWDMQCYLAIINTISEFEDWRPGLAQLLQPVPFPDEALVDDDFIKGMGPVVGSIGNDQRCAVHQCVLGIREGKEGWFHVICPSSAACSDDGSLWASILKTLLDCCCRRKAFLASMTKLVGACQLLALRDHSSAQEALCLMLEWNLLESNPSDDCHSSSGGPEERNSLPLQVATTLQSTESGRRLYFELCDRQLHLKELQQKGGPKKLTLPNRSTDGDLSKLLLNCGSLGNLECLSLAFTQVTSACAQHLIKLPSLRYLNLWSTQFGDSGLQLISEHLHKLQVLNLCETPVTDKGLACLASMKSLRKLNLNSTTLSATTFEKLKQKLPSLQECDVRYTDAW